MDEDPALGSRALPGLGLPDPQEKLQDTQFNLNFREATTDVLG